MGLLTPTDGTLLIDGLNVANKNQIKQWQSNIAHVPQQIFLFDKSVAKNVAFGLPKDKMDLALVREVCRTAKIADTIKASP